MIGPFHEGEVAVQRLAGEEAMALQNGAIIANRIMGGALRFLEQQTMAVLGSRDADQRLWCSVVFGSPGLLSSRDGFVLTLDRTKLSAQSGDPLWSNLGIGAPLAVLAIDLGTRRRIRINGSIEDVNQDRVLIKVSESFPNCPKYIARREIKVNGSRELEASTQLEGRIFGPEQVAMVQSTDTAFLATAHPAAGLDVSHRGGQAGFIEVTGESTLRIPDYPGNGMFNSFGNLTVDTRLGLTLLNVEQERCLQITGSGRLLFDAPDLEGRTGGTNRFLEVTVELWREEPLPVRLTSEFLGYSPFNP